MVMDENYSASTKYSLDYQKNYLHGMVHGCNVQDGHILHSVIYELDSRVGKIAMPLCVIFLSFPPSGPLF